MGVYDERFGRGAEYRAVMSLQGAYAQTTALRESVENSDKSSSAAVRRLRNKLGDLQSEVKFIEPEEGARVILNFLDALDKELRSNRPRSADVQQAFNALGIRIHNAMGPYSNLSVRDSRGE
jgi:hypothetical protein